MELDQALDTGAMALFGEKYGETRARGSACRASAASCAAARTSRAPARSACARSCTKAASRPACAASRRSRARARCDRFQQTSRVAAAGVAALLRTSEPELVDQVEKLLAQQKRAGAATRAAQEQGGASRRRAIWRARRATFKGVQVLAGRVDGLDRQQMRALADSLRNKWKTAVIVLASAEDSNVSIVSAVTKDLTAKVHAGKLAGAVAQAVGGKGGGRPDMAEAGGKDRRGAAGGARERLRQRRGDVVNATVRRRGRRRRSDRPRLRHRTEAARVSSRPLRQGLRA